MLLEYCWCDILGIHIFVCTCVYIHIYVFTFIYLGLYTCNEYTTDTPIITRVFASVIVNICNISSFHDCFIQLRTCRYGYIAVQRPRTHHSNSDEVNTMMVGGGGMEGPRERQTERESERECVGVRVSVKEQELDSV